MDFNIVAVIVAALAAFFLGFLWYTIIFAKPWQKEIGMKDSIDSGAEVKTPSLGKLLVGSLILEIFMAFALDYFFIGNGSDWAAGLMIGLVIGIVFVGFAFGVNYLFEGKSPKLWLINAGYNAAVFAAMGAIIGAM